MVTGIHHHESVSEALFVTKGIRPARHGLQHVLVRPRWQDLKLPGHVELGEHTFPHEPVHDHDRPRPAKRDPIHPVEGSCHHRPWRQLPRRHHLVGIQVHDPPHKRHATEPGEHRPADARKRRAGAHKHQSEPAGEQPQSDCLRHEAGLGEQTDRNRTLAETRQRQPADVDTVETLAARIPLARVVVSAC